MIKCWVIGGGVVGGGAASWAPPCNGRHKNRSLLVTWVTQGTMASTRCPGERRGGHPPLPASLAPVPQCQCSHQSSSLPPLANHGPIMAPAPIIYSTGAVQGPRVGQRNTHAESQLGVHTLYIGHWTVHVNVVFDCRNSSSTDSCNSSSSRIKVTTEQLLV